MQQRDGIPTIRRLPDGIYFRHAEMDAGRWERHSHPWGQLNYVSRGMMNLDVAGRRLISPPHYGIWIPPNHDHAADNAAPLTYRSVYISEARVGGMPTEPCALAISPVLKAILDAFAGWGVHLPHTPRQRRMARVAIDEIEAAAPVDGYLPEAHSPGLRAVLDAARDGLGRKRTTDHFAEAAGMTGRTLERRCRAELGIGFGEWRRRLGFMTALAALDAGGTIQQIAHDLGYASPSAFIAMFRRVCGQTPDQYRRSTRVEF